MWVQDMMFSLAWGALLNEFRLEDIPQTYQLISVICHLLS